jgi:hypothetical protein
LFHFIKYFFFSFSFVILFTNPWIYSNWKALSLSLSLNIKLKKKLALYLVRWRRKRRKFSFLKFNSFCEHVLFKKHKDELSFFLLSQLYSLMIFSVNPHKFSISCSYNTIEEKICTVFNFNQSYFVENLNWVLCFLLCTFSHSFMHSNSIEWITSKEWLCRALHLCSIQFRNVGN